MQNPVVVRQVFPVADQDFNREKIDLIKQTVAKGATDLELELFLHACKRTGLDPLMKQIYAIKRWSQADSREVMSFQTGIDGYRLIADRTEKYMGSDEPVFVLGADGFPDVATVTVYKLVGGQKCAFTHSVRWKEYVQLKKDGTPTSFWVKMPFGQLGKCAEAGALRKAFPAELGGIYTHDEMMQADTDSRKPLRTPSQILKEHEEQSIVTNDTPAEAEARVTAHEQDAQASLLPEYLDQIGLSQSVAECSKTLNTALKDQSLTVFEVAQLNDAGKAKILKLREKK